jgi:hypothetical protein
MAAGLSFTTTLPPSPRNRRPTQRHQAPATGACFIVKLAGKLINVPPALAVGFKFSIDAVSIRA